MLAIYKFSQRFFWNFFTKKNRQFWTVLLCKACHVICEGASWSPTILPTLLSICTWFFKICISQNWFLNLIFELDSLSILNLICTACAACKNEVPNRHCKKPALLMNKSNKWIRRFNCSTSALLGIKKVLM